MLNLGLLGECMSTADLESIKKLAEEILAANGYKDTLKSKEEFLAAGEVDRFNSERRLPTVVVRGARNALDPAIGEHRRRASRDAAIDTINAEKSGHFSYSQVKAKDLEWAFGDHPGRFNLLLDRILAQVKAAFASRSNVVVDDLDLGGPEGIRMDTKVSGLVLRLSKAIRVLP